MIKLLITFLFLFIGTFSIAQDKSNIAKLHFGESWESDYKHIFIDTISIKELNVYYLDSDTSYRIYSIIIKNDTVIIQIDKLPQIVEKAKVIKIGDRLYIPYMEPKALYKIMW